METARTHRSGYITTANQRKDILDINGCLRQRESRCFIIIVFKTISSVCLIQISVASVVRLTTARAALDAARHCFYQDRIQFLSKLFTAFNFVIFLFTLFNFIFIYARR